jgi:hypothetical protein
LLFFAAKSTGGMRAYALNRMKTCPVYPGFNNYSRIRISSSGAAKGNVYFRRGYTSEGCVRGKGNGFSGSSRVRDLGKYPLQIYPSG